MAGAPLPRVNAGASENFSNLEPVDELPVWSVSCFFIRKEHRGKQITKQLLQHAINYARKHGALAIEAYPKDISHTTKRDIDRSLYFGTTKMFEEAGFEEIIRRQPSFPIMRLWL